MHTGLSGILNHKNHSTLLLRAVMYMYTTFKTQWHVRYCHR